MFFFCHSWRHHLPGLILLILFFALSVGTVSAGINYDQGKAADTVFSKGKLRHCFGGDCTGWDLEIEKNGRTVQVQGKHFFKTKKRRAVSWGFNPAISAFDVVTISADRGVFIEEFDMDMGTYVVWNYKNDYVDFSDLFEKNPGMTYEIIEPTKIRFYDVQDFDPITYSSPTITIDDSPGEYDSWDTCATPEDIYNDPDVPATAFYHAETTGSNTTWIMNQTKIKINAGAYVCFDYISFTADHDDNSVNVKLIDNSGYFRLNSSGYIVEAATRDTKTLNAIQTRSGSTTYIYDSELVSNQISGGSGAIALNLLYGTNEVNRTTITGFFRGLVTYVGDVTVDRLTVVNCYEGVSSARAVHNMITPSVPWTDILIRGCDVGYQVHYVDSKAYNIRIEDCGDPASGKYCWDNLAGTGRSHYLVDSNLNWSSVEVQSGHTHYQSYTFNLRVMESGTSNSTSGVNVTLYNSDGSKAFSVLTDANGEITGQEVDFRKWVYTGAFPTPVDTEYYPFNLILTKDGYESVNLSLNYSVIEQRETEGIDLTLTMKKAGEGMIWQIYLFLVAVGLALMLYALIAKQSSGVITPVISGLFLFVSAFYSFEVEMVVGGGITYKYVYDPLAFLWGALGLLMFGMALWMAVKELPEIKKDA